MSNIDPYLVMYQWLQPSRLEGLKPLVLLWLISHETPEIPPTVLNCYTYLTQNFHTTESMIGIPVIYIICSKSYLFVIIPRLPVLLAPCRRLGIFLEYLSNKQSASRYRVKYLVDIFKMRNYKWTTIKLWMIREYYSMPSLCSCSHIRANIFPNSI